MTLAERFPTKPGLQPADLESVLEDAVARARAEWPELDVKPGDFVAYVAARIGSEGDPVEELASRCLGDLYLACGCASGDKVALAAFERVLLAGVGRHVAAIDASATFADEVRQELRAKLFVTDEACGRRRKIEEYEGRGPLAGWLRVTAIRVALNMRRGRRPPDGDDAAKNAPAASPDPELDYLKARCQREFRAAFVAALATLSPEERNVLRLHHLDGLTLEQTSAACRISRATAARWLARARARILDETHRLLKTELRLSGGEVQSVLRLVESQLDVSLHRYLGDAPLVATKE